MKKNITRIILIILLLVGIGADLFLLADRIGAEMDDRDVVAAAYYHDIVRLSDESGLSEEEWLETLAGSGVRYLIFMETPSQEILGCISALDMEPAGFGNLEGDWAFVVPNEDEELRDIGDTPLVIMKNAYRTAAVVPIGFDIEEYSGPMIKAVYMYSGYANRYKDDIRGEEIENVLFRAITDRGARLLLLRPITYKDYSLVLDPGVYTEVLCNVAERIADRGYSYGESYSILRADVMSRLELWLTGLVPVVIWIFLATRVKPIKRFGLVLAALGLAGTGAVCYIMPDLAQKVLALACAIGFSLTWMWGLYNYFMLEKGKRFPAAVGYILGLASVLIWGILGGLAVAAIQTDLRYMMGETIFSGVKLSMILPLVVCGAVFAMPILRRIRARDYTKRELLGMLPALLVILVAMGVLIRRSGDTGGEISELENNLRVAFEYAYYARPRTKEILVAVPFMALLFIPGGRKDSMLRLIGGLCCGLECVSVINTFCHGLAPIHVSLLRGSLAAASGALLGLVIIAFFSLINKYRQKLMPDKLPEGGDEG